MKAVGLITEYNPLHNGHIYHMNQALKAGKADAAVVVMSGNFVQRGEPAVINKYMRCRAAIDSGANLVVELPAYYSLSSAEGFAEGAVKTLNELKVNSFVFGSESADIDALKAAANIIVSEPDAYRSILKKELASGKSFPAARQKALHIYASQNGINIDSDILVSPNNILAIEYIKTVLKYNFKIKPLTIKRIGSGYNEKELDGTFPSAQSIRNILASSEYGCSTSDDLHSSPETIFTQLSLCIPESMMDILKSSYKKIYPVISNDFTAVFNYKMLEIFEKCNNDKDQIICELCTYEDISSELAARIYSNFNGYLQLNDFILKIKCRQYTFSRISRCIFHIILNIKKLQKNKFEGKTVPYIRILGFDKKGQNYLNSIKKAVSVPIVTKAADYKELIHEDIHAASIYNQIVYNKFRQIPQDEFRSGIYIKK